MSMLLHHQTKFEQNLYPLNFINFLPFANVGYRKPFDNPLSTYLILLYTSSSAMSRPSLLYVVSTNTRTFGSILNLASDLWSWVLAESAGDLFSVWQCINGIGFVSRRISLRNIRTWMKIEKNVNLLWSNIKKPFIECDCRRSVWKGFSLVQRLMFQFVFMSVDLSRCQVSLYRSDKI